MAEAAGVAGATDAGLNPSAVICLLQSNHFMKKKNKDSALVNRLSAVALTLPGLVQQADAGRIDESYDLDFQYGHYSESDDRMEADVFQGALSAPLGRSMTASINLVRDTLSGASPMFNFRDRQGQIRQILSGATIREQRDAISADLTYFFDTVALGIGGGFSRENDYVSRFVNTNLSWDLNKKLTTLNFGASVAFDEIEPTGESFRRSKTSQQYLLGISQIVDRNTVIRSNITFGYHKGFLSDPYKKVLVEGKGLQSDTRPAHKFEWAWLAQYVHHFKPFNGAALHADYRFYNNDWGISAHTFEFSWNQPILDGWQVIPRVRYYSQDEADFYQPLLGRGSQATVFSSDYRLAGFGALSGGVKISKEFPRLGPLDQMKIQVGFEYYHRKSSYQLGGDGTGSFDDFNYYLVTASINVKF